jgi:hypothetical protein
VVPPPFGGIIVERKEKMNLSFAPDIKEYLQIQSEYYGMSVSAYLTMLVSNHRRETEAMSTMGNLGQLMDKMQKFLDSNDRSSIGDRSECS